MRAAVAEADRRHAVRSAAKGWRRAGAIDDTTLRAIVAAYPDDRHRLGIGLRVLAGLAAFISGVALAGMMYTLLNDSVDESVIAGALAVVFAAATELQVGRLRRAQAGAEYATAMLSAAFAALALGRPWLDSSGLVFLCLAGVTFAIAAWRWGHPTLAALAAIFVLAGVAQGSGGRAIWLVSGIVAIPMIIRGARSGRWAPRHRESLKFAGLVLLTGAYLATNLVGFDDDWIAHGEWPRSLEIAGTILLPPLVVFAGVRYRDLALLAAGGVFTLAWLVTLRPHVGWVSMILAGATTLAGAVMLRRWLHAGPGHERSGFTAEPLFDDRRAVEAAKIAAVIATVSPEARLADRSGFAGGGGKSGGGGATGTT